MRINLEKIGASVVGSCEITRRRWRRDKFKVWFRVSQKMDLKWIRGEIWLT